MSPPYPPRKSAVAIVLAPGEDGVPRVLVGRRDPRSRFLGGYLAFPGGAHDAEDGDPREEGEEMVLRRTASRELREETGVVIAPEAFEIGGRRVTPPFAPRRFDSLMFVARVEAPVPCVPENPDEMQDLEWASPVDLLARWRRLELRVSPPLLPILQELAEGPPPERAAERIRSVNEDMEADGPRVEFVPDILMIPVETATLPPATHTNCYLVGSREFLVVDPGCGSSREQARLLRHVVRRREEAGPPRAVVLTHHHGDHVGAAAFLARELGVEVLAHERTRSLWGGQAGDLADGDRLSLSGGETIEVLHTPGHAPGHVALFERRGGSLLAGDLVSGVSTILVESGPGRLDEYLASLERIRDLEARTLFPSHGPPMIAPRRAVQRVLDHRGERERKILRALEEGPKPVPEIVRLAYADTPAAPPQLAAQQALSHLLRLEGRGRAREERGVWYLQGRGKEGVDPARKT